MGITYRRRNGVTSSVRNRWDRSVQRIVGHEARPGRHKECLGPAIDLERRVTSIGSIEFH